MFQTFRDKILLRFSGIKIANFGMWSRPPGHYILALLRPVAASHWDESGSEGEGGAHGENIFDEY